MLPLPVLDSHAPPVRVMALHALAYCRRLFYLEEVEEIRVADSRVFAGRHLHAALEADEEGDATRIERKHLVDLSITHKFGPDRQLLAA
jgi:CRISP-associated protein Cas1